MIRNYETHCEDEERIEWLHSRALIKTASQLSSKKFNSVAKSLNTLQETDYIIFQNCLLTHLQKNCFLLLF